MENGHRLRKVVEAMLLALLVLAIAACSKGTAGGPDAGPDFNGKMDGVAYVGKTTSRLYLHGYDALPSVDGRGSFSIDKINGDSSTIALVVELGTGEGFTFGVPGKQQGLSWQAAFADASLLIKANGEVDGKMVSAGKEITWDGHLFDDKLLLDIRIKYLASEGDIPESSILATRLDLVNPASSEPGSTGSGCEVIVWQTRPVFNIYGGGVDLISVPVCH